MLRYERPRSDRGVRGLGLVEVDTLSVLSVDAVDAKGGGRC